MSIYETMQNGLCGFFKYSQSENEGTEEETEEVKDIITGVPEDDVNQPPSEPEGEQGQEMTGNINDNVVWHASPDDFDEFLFKEIGFHFAETKELAENAAIMNGKYNAVARPYKISAQNMVEVTGQKNGFKGHKLIEDMFNRGYINQEQYEGAINALYDFEDNFEEYEQKEHEAMEDAGYYLPFDTYKQAESSVLKNFFDEWGIDGLKYWNDFDAYGLASLFGENFTQDLDGVKPNWSYIVFDNSQITKL